MKWCLFVFLLAWNSLAFSQGFKVKEFKQNISDGSAFNAPLDAEGHPCGLIKVRTDVAELQFKGDVMGDVENKTNEYWVYMAKGSKQLGILHPNFLPMTVNLMEYGIAEVDSKATYIMTLTETKFKKEKCGVVMTVKPESAALYVDNVFVENLSGNGYYQLFLPKGDHVCRVAQRGYRPYVQAMTTGKGTQNLNVELESVMAELEIKSRTETAEIYVDGERKGNGTWKGFVIAGEHQIEAWQQNFEPYALSVSVAEKESRTFVIPQLKRAMGKVRIVTNPSGMPVMLDGKEVGISPCTVEVETGKHYVICKSYGVSPVRSDVEINDGTTSEVKLQIQYEEGWQKEEYQKAYNGSLKDILNLAGQACRMGNYHEAVFWIDRHPQSENVVKYWNNKYGKETDTAWWQCDWILAYSEAGNPEKALELYPIWKANDESHMFFDDLEMSYIGNGFLKKKDYDKAMQCFQKSGRYGYEGLGDCYRAKGNKQQAASYYRKCLNLDYYDGKDRVEKKLKEMGQETNVRLDSGSLANISRARTFIEVGNYVAAKEMLERVLELNPNYAPALELMEICNRKIVDK